MPTGLKRRRLRIRKRAPQRVEPLEERVLLSGTGGTDGTPEIRLNETTDHWQGTVINANQATAALPSGGFVSVWTSYRQDGSVYGVYGQRFSRSGDRIGPEFRVNETTKRSQRAPSVDVAEDGRFAVVWQSHRQDSSNFGVFARLYNADGTPATDEFRVNYYTKGLQANADVAFLADGNVAFTWHGSGGTDYFGVYGRVFDESGSAIGEQFRANSFTKSRQTNPVIVGDASGGFWIAWSGRGDDDRTSIWARRFSATGEKLSGAFRVNQYRKHLQLWPTMAAADDGRILIGWASQQDRETSWGIYSRLYDAAGEALSDEFLANHYTKGAQVRPSVGFVSDGGYVIAWSGRGYGDKTGVFARRFNSDGVPHHREERVNLTTDKLQTRPSVGAGAGGYTISWNGNGPGDNHGLFARYYQTNLPPELLPVADQFAVPENELVVSIAATDPDLPNDTLVFGAGDRFPEGASIDPDSGEFTWTPSAEDQGTSVDVDVVVTDDAGARDEASFRIDVGLCSLNAETWSKAEYGGSESAAGSVEFDGCTAVLREGDSFLVSLETSFLIPEDPSEITLTYGRPDFDKSDPDFINDAFEIALLDREGNPLAAPHVAGRDSFFNITETLGVAAGEGVARNGRTVSLDISDVLPGEQATLVIRLANNDSDSGSSVSITDVAIPGNFPAEKLRDGTNYPQEGAGGSVSALLREEAAAARVSPGADAEQADAGPLSFTFRTAEDFAGGTLFNTQVDVGTDSLQLNPASDTEVFPFIWIANFGEGTISKFDVRTGEELGRYRTGPESLGGRLQPSRVAVTGEGDAWVANRAEGIQASITKVLNQGFIDRNGNGVVDTATDVNGDGSITLDEVLPWDANGDGLPDDERIAITVAAGRDRNNPDILRSNGFARAIAIDADDNVWVGLYNHRQYEVYDGTTATLLQVVPTSGRPYGAAIDANDNLWSAAINDRFLERIDTVTRTPVQQIRVGQTYGVTVAPDGAVWGAGWTDRRMYRYDPVTGDTRYYATPNRETRIRGIAVDRAGDVWLSSSSSNRVIKFDLDPETLDVLSTQIVGVGSEPTAVVMDAEGFIWTTARGNNTAWKIDAATAQVVEGWPVTTGQYPYNYSDMTGVIRQTITKRSGTWSERIDSGRLNAQWLTAQLLADTPTDTAVAIRLRAANDLAELESLDWRTVQPLQALAGTNGRFLDVELTLESSDAALNPRVFEFAVQTTAAPQIRSLRPDGEGSLPIGTTLISGQAIADAALLDNESTFPNSITHVLINGTPVEALDVSGHFYAHVELLPGTNKYAIEAFDEYGQGTVAQLALTGRTVPGIDFTRFTDITGSFSGVYGRTSFTDETQQLQVNLATRNDGTFETDVPLLVGVRNISDADVSVVAPDGFLPDGTPYFDYTTAVPGSRLGPGEVTGSPTIRFRNPNLGQFDYELVFLGDLNDAPIIETVPLVESTFDREYRYDVDATDPDGDEISYRLTTGPDGMQIDPVSGEITWTPAASDRGLHDVEVVASDGRGGVAAQSFTVVVGEPRPNRPPIITSTPVTTASVAEATRGEVGVDLSAWTAVDLDPSAPGNWVLSPDGNTVRQTTNNGPFFFLSDFDVASQRIKGSFRVDGGDDDFAGFVFGYQETEPERAEFYVFDWKRSPQTNPGGAFGDRGTSVKLVNATLPLTETELFATAGVPGRIETLYHDNGLGWSIGATYEFTLEFRDGGFTVQIEQSGSIIQTIEIADDTYRDGRFGFYNLSQPHVEYSGFTRETIASATYAYHLNAIDPDADELTYALSEAPDGMRINESSGAIRWAPTAGQVGNHDVGVEVTDGNGGIAIQEFVVCVHPDPENHPPTIISTPITEYSFPPDNATIDFETTPSGASVDRQIISNQFLESHGVSFRFEDGSHPELAKVGAPLTAFSGPPNNSGADTVADPDRNGQFFITDDGVVGAPPPPLLIDYVFPVAAASGEILDISGGEAWRIEALDSSGVVIDSMDLTDSDPTAGDGIATPWRVTSNEFDIHQIRISDIGTKTDRVGLAFDNFSPAGGPGVYRYQADAIDPDNDELSYSVVSGPAGMTVDEESGLIERLVIGRQVASRFDQSLDGWTADTDAEVFYQSVAGNPGGFMRVRDRVSDTASPDTSILAPSEFLGDLSTYNGGTLSVDAILLDAGLGPGTGQPGLFGTLSITGGDLSATLDIASVVPGAEWTSYSIPLTAETAGMDAGDWSHLLANVTQIRMIVEEYAGNDTYGIDNFVVRAPDIEPVTVRVEDGRGGYDEQSFEITVAETGSGEIHGAKTLGPADRSLLNTFGPSPYLNFDDSPFRNVDFTRFYLEDFEDGILNTPGVSANAGRASAGYSVFRDSVDGDDGVIDGNGQTGGSFGLVRETGDTEVTFEFDELILGALPTHAGVVWTDVGFFGGYYGQVTLTAFDEAGDVIASVGPAEVGDGSDRGETAEDRFLGVASTRGIKTLRVAMDSSDWTLDHLQYGFAPDWRTPEAGVAEYFAASGDLPSEVLPPWSTANPGAATLLDDVLRISTGNFAEGASFIQQEPLIDTGGEFFVEARLKYVSGGASNPAREPIVLGTTTGPGVGSLFYIGEDSVFLTTGTVVAGPKVQVDTDDGFHTYRVEYAADGSIKVLYDGQQILTGSTYSSSLDHGQTQRIFWGDGTVGASGVSDWEYVRHNAVAETRADGWTIYLDQNQNGIRDIGEQSTVTAPNGDYAFTDLPEGTYYVREEPRQDWLQTFPGTAGSVTDTSVDINFKADGSADDALGDNDGALVGGTGFTDGVFGEAFLFDGADDAVRVDSSTDFDFGVGDFSVDFWVRFDDLVSNSNGIIAKDSFAGDNSTATGWLFNICDTCGDVGGFGKGNAGFGFEVRDIVNGVGSHTHARISTEALTVGEFYHVAGVRESGVLRLYLNGDLVEQIAEDAPANVSNTADLFIGQLHPVGPQSFAGAVDEVRISSSARSVFLGSEAAHTVVLGDGDTAYGVDFANEQVGDLANRLPVIQTKPDPVAIASRLFRYDASASDPENDPITFSLPLAPDGMTVHPSLGTVVWIPGFDQVGTHNILLRAADDRGGVDVQAFTLTVVEPNVAPTITSTPPLSAADGTRLVYQLAAQDADSDRVQFRLRQGPDGMNVAATEVRNSAGDIVDTRYTLTWDVTGVGSTHDISVVADDGRGGEAVQSFTLVVRDNSVANTTPVIMSQPPTTARFGREWTWVVMASDADGDPLTFSLPVAPPGMTISQNGVVSWTPPSDADPIAPVEVVVEDGRNGLMRRMFDLSVVGVEQNDAPVITSVPGTSAVLDQLYAYNPVAVDPQNDELVWSLSASPRGMSIDSQTGRIRWTPDDQQLGAHIIAVTTSDAFAGRFTQRFEVHVGCNNLAPAIVSIPPTIALTNRTYLYAVRADDFENDRLSWRLTSAPAGMTIDARTGVIRWTPALSQIDSHDVSIEVSDGLNVGTQSYTVVVNNSDDLVDPNDPSQGTKGNRAPIFTSTPAFAAEVGSLYSYQVRAVDPDGDDYTLSLTGSVPDGMLIDANGLITWTPDAADAGEYIVSVTATDDPGATSVQGYALTVRTNGPPVITSSAVESVTRNALYRYSVRATDPDGDPLDWELTAAPDGMTIDGRGRIVWDTSGFAEDTADVTVTVADDRGQTDAQSWTITLTNDTQPPVVSISITSEGRFFGGDAALNVGSVYTVRVLATDNVGVAEVGLSVNGEPVALDSDQSVTLNAEALGIVALTAFATDTSNLRGESESRITVTDPQDGNRLVPGDPDAPPWSGPAPGDTGQPIVTITSPAIGSTISNVVPIIGTVDDPEDNLWYYRVHYARADRVSITDIDLDDSDWIQIGEGTEEVIEGELAVFNPAGLRNDAYAVIVEGYDVNGAGYVRPTLFQLEGNVLVGNFQLELTDLSIPLAGIPIDVTRVYDSINAVDDGDFGFGWRLGVQDARILEVTALSAGGAFNPGNDKFIPNLTKVYLTNPSGQRVGFTYQEELVSYSFFGGVWRPRFVPDPGVYDRLAIDETTVARGGIIGDLAQGINPAFYSLTTKDNLRYRYADSGELQTITDPNGNVVTFTDSGIAHSSGQSVAFIRDHRDRIERIVDPAGNEIVYEYDLAGDLVAVTNQSSLTTTYEYRSDNPHFLNRAFDPQGKQAFEVQYDSSGVFTGVLDANGNRIDSRSYTNDRNEAVIRDAAGNPTTLFYDDRGNVLREIDPQGNTTFREYNDPVNPDLETRIIDRRGFITERTYDARGNVLTIEETGTESNPFEQPIVTQFTYDTKNNVTSITNAQSQTTTFEYDSRDNLVTITNALEDESFFTYDSQGRRTTFTDFNGNTTEFEYTDACPCGSPSKVIYDDDTYQTFEYNQFGQVTIDATFEADGTLVERRETQYDSSGRVTAEISGLPGDPDHPQTIVKRFYDGHLLDWEVIVHPDSLDTAGNLLESPATPVADRKSRITDFEYDNSDRVIRQIDAEGGVVDFRYDAQGNRVALRDPVGNITTWVYDSLNRVVEERDPFYWVDVRESDAAFADLSDDEFLDLVAPVVPVSDQNPGDPLYDDPSGADCDTNTRAEHIRLTCYDAEGNQAKSIDRNGRRREFDYDHVGRLLQETWFTADTATLVETISFTYDELGNMLTATDSNSNYLFEYDALNRLRSVDNNPDGTRDVPRVVLTYAYDAQGNATRTQDDTGVTVDSEYDERNRLAIRNWYDADGSGDVDDARVDFHYNAAGRESGVQRYSDLSGSTLVGSTTRTYDTAGRSDLLRHDDAVGDLLASYDYDYDFSGLLIHEERDHQDSQYAQSIDYTYDLTGQLTDAFFSGQDDEHYVYDANGNRITSEVGSDQRTYTTGPANQLTSDGVYRYEYDGEGNQIKRVDLATGETRTFEYDHHNRLVQVDDWSSDPGDPQNPAGGAILTHSVGYTYDAMGRRIATLVDEDGTGSARGDRVSYAYDRDNGWNDWNDNGDRTHYMYGGEVDQNLARAGQDSTSWYLPDRLRTIRLITTASGQIANLIEYSSTGTKLSQSNATFGVRFGFTGRELGKEGLYYFRARWFDSANARFQSQDPIGFLGDPTNVYRYALGSPTNGTDPFGLAVLVEYSASTQDDAVVYSSGSQSLGTLNDIPIQVISKETGKVVYKTSFESISKGLTADKWWTYGQGALELIIPAEFSAPGLAQMVITYVRAALPFLFK